MPIKAVKQLIKRTGIHRPIRRAISSGYRKECRLLEQMVAEANRRGFEKIARKHSDSKDSSRKYLDLSEHGEEAVQLAARLDLLDSKPLRILDIGCGAGLFLFALQQSGHRVVGIDLSDTQLYNDMVELLGISRLVHRVEPRQKLPDFGEPFDLITAFSICFDNMESRKVWGPDEWKFFLDDCISRLNPGGRIFLNFNPKNGRDFNYIPTSVAQMLRAMPNGKLSESKEFFTLVKS
jgi:2-polyprenyl-3-methyl-5-hydroxy-6-metoxy-1,4-benzoquinol methylase